MSLISDTQINLVNCRHSPKLGFPLYSFSLNTLLQTPAANRHPCCAPHFPVWTEPARTVRRIRSSSLLPYLVFLHVNIIRTDFAQLCPCHLHDADGPAPREQKGEKSQQWPQPHPGGKSLPCNSRHSPFIIAEVFVCKLLKEGPFHHLLRSVVLQEVDEHVLQAGVVLGGWGLFGKQVQPGVLLMECLPMEHTS